ncbi:MAG: 50S ribosomal protein L6 [Saprospiraceae bacterium]
MSRIGNAPISIPNGVSWSTEKSVVSVKGPKGELFQIIDPDITVKEEDGSIVIERPTNQKRHKAMHGLYRSLINNMVIGVSEGFTKSLELVGVGYRCSSKGQLLELSLGYSHPIFFHIPDEVKLETKMEKGSNPTVLLSSTDKQLIGEVAAKIRKLRKPEPYKGKGIRFTGEEIRRKAGKTAAK